MTGAAAIMSSISSKLCVESHCALTLSRIKAHWRGRAAAYPNRLGSTSAPISDGLHDQLDGELLDILENAESLAPLLAVLLVHPVALVALVLDAQAFAGFAEHDTRWATRVNLVLLVVSNWQMTPAVCEALNLLFRERPILIQPLGYISEHAPGRVGICVLQHLLRSLLKVSAVAE
jgi:hypothetical protein